MIRTVQIDGTRITDWPEFHDAFAQAFGFPEFYGRNLDAWVDCMTRLDEDFNGVRLAQGELLMLQITDAAAMKDNAPQILSALFEMASFVNYRRVEIGQAPILIVSCYA